MTVGNDVSLFQRWWPLAVVLGTGLVAWGATTTSLSANAEDDAKVEIRVAALEKDISEIKQAITRIETNQERDTEEAARMRASLDALVAALQRIRQSGE